MLAEGPVVDGARGLRLSRQSIVEDVEVDGVVVYDVGTLGDGQSFLLIDRLLVAGTEASVPVAVDVVVHEDVATGLSIIDGACTPSPLYESGIGPYGDVALQGVYVPRGIGMQVVVDAAFQVGVVDAVGQRVGRVVSRHQTGEVWLADVDVVSDGAAFLSPGEIHECRREYRIVAVDQRVDIIVNEAHLFACVVQRQLKGDIAFVRGMGDRQFAAHRALQFLVVIAVEGVEGLLQHFA